MYQINQLLIPEGDSNRPGTRLNPEGIIIHSTAMDEVPGENIAKYFAYNRIPKTTNVASAHYVIDWDFITEMIPENEVAYHAGPKVNYTHLSIEMCETNDSVRFTEVWKRTVWLAAEICKRYNWNPDDSIRSHNWVSRTLGGTDHTDPIAFFAQFGKTMDDLIHDIKAEMEDEEDMEKNILPPDWAKATAEKLKNKKGPDGQPILRGDGSGQITGTETFWRILVINDRAGLYDTNKEEC